MLFLLRNRLILLLVIIFSCQMGLEAAPSQRLIKSTWLAITVNAGNGNFQLARAGESMPLLKARMGAKVGDHWVYSNLYPTRTVTDSSFHDALGSGQRITVVNSGLSGEPELIETLELYHDRQYGLLQVAVRNTTNQTVQVSELRDFQSLSGLNTGAPNAFDRVLSDSFSEDTPALRIYNLGAAPHHVHLGYHSQLIYNRHSRESVFFGALTAHKFLTVITLKAAPAQDGRMHVASFTADSTGTTAVESQNSLRFDPAFDKIPLQLAVAPGHELRSEPLLFAAGSHYRRILESYGNAVRVWNHARVSGPAPQGWWSWSAYVHGLDEGAALTNAQWLADHLSRYGFDYFHVDDGYMYARGEYTTPDATLFPEGMRYLGRHVTRLGLRFGIWTAPFEVSEHSWVFEHHPHWLVRNRDGQPIPLGYVSSYQGHHDRLYALDTTNPGAQRYLFLTYRILTRQWGIRYIKLDFMDSSDIEGVRYRPNTSAMEALRIGLEIIRKAVGQHVLLDKDGSPMLAPVGLVDEGRISQDTGRSFLATRQAAPGIAARFYMDRNFFVSDPDSFTVSREVIGFHTWHMAAHPLTLNEARASIVLAALAGGMYEVSDDLPTLGSEPRRLALVENHDLLDMVRLGKAALPLDLMTYRPQDRQPSIFFLHEDARQSMLAVFNWTDQARHHDIKLASLPLPQGSYQAYDALRGDRPYPVDHSALVLKLAPRSVCLLKLIDTKVAASAPRVQASVPSSGDIEQPVNFRAQAMASGVPALAYEWTFGDGTHAKGAQVNHAFTHDGVFTVQLRAPGLDGVAYKQSFHVQIRGQMNPHIYTRPLRRLHPPVTGRCPQGGPPQ